MDSTQDKKTDVLIVGGGIAGLTLAKFLAEEGIDTIVLEEDTKFGNKACGEAVAQEMSGYNFYELYGSKRGITNSIESAIIDTKYGAIEQSLPSYIINKSEVETELANQVVKKGAKIIMGDRVNSIKYLDKTVQVLPHNILSKLIVGADGLNSIVRSTMGIKTPKFGLASNAIVNAETWDKMIFEFKQTRAKHGYAWFFPKKEEWNIGVGSANPKYHKRALESFMKDYPHAKNWKTSAVPIGLPIKSYGKNSLLVGDSAGQVIAALAEGNMPSMICADIAAKAIKNSYMHNEITNAPKLYERMWQRELGSTFKQGYLTYVVLSASFSTSEFLFFNLMKLFEKLYPIV